MSAFPVSLFTRRRAAPLVAIVVLLGVVAAALGVSGARVLAAQPTSTT